jgi:hypothetical protein
MQLALDGDAYSMYTVGWLNCEDKIEGASMTRCLTWYLIAAFHRNEEAKKVLPAVYGKLKYEEWLEAERAASLLNLQMFGVPIVIYG